MQSEPTSLHRAIPSVLYARSYHQRGWHGCSFQIRPFILGNVTRRKAQRRWIPCKLNSKAMVCHTERQGVVDIRRGWCRNRRNPQSCTHYLLVRQFPGGADRLRGTRRVRVESFRKSSASYAGHCMMKIRGIDCIITLHGSTQRPSAYFQLSKVSRICI